MILSEPIYIPRPLVEPEMFASLRPPLYDGAMATEEGAVKQPRGAYRSQPQPFNPNILAGGLTNPFADGAPGGPCGLGGLGGPWGHERQSFAGGMVSGN